MNIHSKRTDNNTVDISIITEDLFRHLFGYTYDNLHGSKNEKKWRHLLNKLIEITEVSIEKNVNSDSFHLSKIERYLSIAKSCMKSKENEEIEIIISLFGIIFQLLGCLPNYSDKKTVQRKNNYYLRNFRTLNYTQSSVQKVNLIFHISNYKYKEELKDIDLYEVFYQEYHGNTIKFLSWFKENYPRIYVELF